MMTIYASLQYPCNLWSTIHQREIKGEELPRDWEAALDYVLENMTHRLAKETLLLYFKEGSTLREVGAKVGMTASGVEQKIKQTIKQLQKPYNATILDYGLAYGQDLIAALRVDNELMAAASVENLNISTRAITCLKRAKILTIGQLKECGDEDLFKIRNLGEGTLREIKQALVDFVNPKQKSPEDEAAGKMRARLIADISSARVERIKGGLWASDERIADYLLSRGWTLPTLQSTRECD